MRYLFACLALVAAVLLAPQSQASDKQNLVTILSSEEPQTQLMAMVLTMQSLKQGNSAYILLCGPAGDLALKNPPASAVAPQKPKGMSPQGLMKMIMANGGTVDVCAIYLPNKGVGKDALVTGVGAAKPPAMAKRLMGDDTQLMSF